MSHVYLTLTHDSFRVDLKCLINSIKSESESIINRNINNDKPISENLTKAELSLKYLDKSELEDVMITLIANDVFIAFDHDDKENIDMTEDALIIRPTIYKASIVIYCTLKKK